MAATTFATIKTDPITVPVITADTDWMLIRKLALVRSSAFAVTHTRTHTHTHTHTHTLSLFSLYSNGTDVDECSESTDECNQICSNTVGSYVCYCNTGYELLSNQKTCVGKKQVSTPLPVCAIYLGIVCSSFSFSDTNECGLSNGGCNQTCNNTVGSYACSCGSGWLLGNDSHDCDGEETLRCFLSKAGAHHLMPKH